MSEQIIVHYCEHLSKCKWQGFGTLRGLGFGTIADTTPQWRDWHSRECGGRLMDGTVEEVSLRAQLTAKDAEITRIRADLAEAQKKVNELYRKLSAKGPLNPTDYVDSLNYRQQHPEGK